MIYLINGKEVKVLADVFRIINPVILKKPTRYIDGETPAYWAIDWAQTAAFNKMDLIEGPETVELWVKR